MDRQITVSPHVRRLRSRPCILPLRIGAQWSEIVDAGEQLLKLKLEVREKSRILVVRSYLIRKAVAFHRRREIPRSPLGPHELESLDIGKQLVVALRPALRSQSKLSAFELILHPLHR